MIHLFLLMCLAGDAESKRFALETEHFNLMPEQGHIQVGKGGVIYIADPTNHTIRSFSPSGDYLFDVGRRGEGPGEIKRWFGEFSIDTNGRIYQLDHWGGNRWVNIFAPDGTFLKVFSLKNVPGVFGARNVFQTLEADILVGIEHNWKTQKKDLLFFGGSDVSFFKMKADSSLGMRLFSTHLTMEISEEPDSEGRPIPNAPEVIVAYEPSLRILAWQVTNEDRVTLIDVNSNKKVRVPNGFSRRPMVKENILAFVEKRLSTDIPANYRAYEKRLYSKMVDMSKKIDMSIPIVHRLFFNERGELFLVSGEADSDSFTIHVLAKDHRIVRKFKQNAVPIALAGNKGYYLENDKQEGLSFLVVKKRDPNY